MRTRVKICCIASPEEAQLAIAHGADAIGLVGWMPSGPGPIDDELIRRIARGIPPPIETFLLTACETAGDIAEHVAYCGTTTVQIVNHIDPAEYPTIADRLPATRRVQVIHVEDDGALELARHYAPYVHAFLLDSGRPSASLPELGGTGRVHDWRVSAEIVRQADRPVFLAGGLHPGNVSRAVATVRPFGLDLCSGVRTDGYLDPDKLGRFFAAVRRADGKAIRD